jgi:DDE superfamily endonuclease
VPFYPAPDDDVHPGLAPAVPVLPGRDVPQHPRSPVSLGHDRGGMGGPRAVTAAPAWLAGRAAFPPGTACATSSRALMLAVDVSNWLRLGAATSPDRLFCHVYGRGKGQAQMIPGWPCSVVAALEPGRTSWTAVLDAVRLGPEDDGTEVTAAQVREVITRLIAAGHWREGTCRSW